MFVAELIGSVFDKKKDQELKLFRDTVSELFFVFFPK